MDACLYTCERRSSATSLEEIPSLGLWKQWTFVHLLRRKTRSNLNIRGVFSLITEASLCHLYSPYRRFQICFFHQDYFWTVCHSFTVTYLLHTELYNKTIYSPIYYLLTYITVNVNKKIRRYFCVFLIIWQESFFHKKDWFKLCPKKPKQTTSK